MWVLLWVGIAVVVLGVGFGLHIAYTLHKSKNYSARWQQGHDHGYKEGHEEGYSEGYMTAMHEVANRRIKEDEESRARAQRLAAGAPPRSQAPPQLKKPKKAKAQPQPVQPRYPAYAASERADHEYLTPAPLRQLPYPEPRALPPGD
jgi:hypothetical protein